MFETILLEPNSVRPREVISANSTVVSHMSRWIIQQSKLACFTYSSVALTLSWMSRSES